MFSTNKSVKVFFIQLRQCALAALLIFSINGQADDTEIYMGTGQSTASETHPNVLFILDTSGSMNARDAGANQRTPRMTVLKQAMDDLLTSIDNVNVGLSRFSNSGGSVIFPISPINGNANVVVGESKKAKALSFTAVLVNPEDDAEERVSGSNQGAVFLHDDVLEMFDFGGTTGQKDTHDVSVTLNSDDISEFNRGGRMLNTTFAYIHHVVSLGLRFQNVNIQQGTTIQSAFIDFTHRIRRTNRTNAKIFGIAIGNTSTFSNSSRDLSSRPKTTTSVAWDGIPGGQRNTKFTTPDLTSIVQEIVNRSDWSSGNSMGFNILTTRGTRYPYSRNASSTRQPKLRIQVQATQGTQGEDQLIALRFEDIRIPRGATLTEAKLLLTNRKQGGGGQSVWRISAEQVDDSPEFSSASGSLSARKGGGTVVNWTVKSDVLNTEPASCGTGCTEQRTKESNDIKSVIQEVTSRSGWCGGNSITIFIDANNPQASELRHLHSRDSSEAQLAPKLVYKYMPQAGCMNKKEVAQIAASGDDAVQFKDGGYSNASRVNTVGDVLTLGDDSRRGAQTIGLRFTEVDVPKNAVVKDAHIEFRAKGTSSGQASYKIQGIDDDTVRVFRGSTNDISNRILTTATSDWVMSGTNAEDDWDDPGAEHQTGDLTSIVQEIVNRTGWSSRNSMGFVITGTGTRNAESFDSDPSKSPRLVIKYDDSVKIPFKSVREAIKEKVKELPARGGTPIAGAMLETAKYFRGDKMRHGKNRGTFGEISHPGTYCKAPGNCPGATPTTGGGGYYGNSGSTDEFMVLNPNGCTKNNLGSFRCRNRKINGSPQYISPIRSDLSCAANHQVLLTDGQAFGRDDSAIKQLLPKNSCYKDNESFKLDGHKKHSYINAHSGYGYGYGASNQPTAESCVPDLVEFMAKEDQNKKLKGKQSVKTHTVAFALKQEGPVQFLKDVANLGQGGFYSADTAGDLQDVFKVILSEVRSAPTSFAAPSLAVNAFNKILSREDVYFGMFTPDLKQSWDGNVKKYKMCLTADCGGSSAGTILDKNSNTVIDTSVEPNLFKKDAHSEWSKDPDGNITTKGGAGEQISDFQKVTLLTDKSPSITNFEQLKDLPLKGTSGLTLDHSNWRQSEMSLLRNAICKNPSTDDNNANPCKQRMLFLLGKKFVSKDTDVGPGNDQRWSVSDILHSQPKVITYGGEASSNTFHDKVIYGTNAGFLHMINGATGKEEWRYLPSDFWSMQRQIFDNRQDNHLYGIDGTPLIWQCDVNNDGTITPHPQRNTTSLGEATCSDAEHDFVRVIVSTRRGGGDSGFIYALDLSDSVEKGDDKVNPKFMWRISGGDTTGDFRRLGQTWSDPKLMTIMVTKDSTGLGFPKEVIVFGGGYDPKLDDETKFSTSDNDGNDYLGNAIYIVDPMNGKKLLSISGTGSGADIEVGQMNFSIPSDITTLDSNSDGIVDRLYVGDTGGQLWRVDLAEALPIGGSGSKGNTVVGLLAQISGNDAKNRRKFFEPPSVLQVSDAIFSTAEQYDLVMLGTGDRPNPLSATVADRFYAFRDRFISNNSIGDSNTNNVSSGEGYPTSTSKPYSHEDASSILDVTTKGLTDMDSSLVKVSDGWYVDFTTANTGVPGEKVLSAPLTAGFNVHFTTFDPTVGDGTSTQTATQKDKSDPCGAVPNIGEAKFYKIPVLDAGTPEIEGASKRTGSNRFRQVIGSGIPSDVIPVFTPDTVIAITQADGQGISLGDLCAGAGGCGPQRAYWNESIDF